MNIVRVMYTTDFRENLDTIPSDLDKGGYNSYVFRNIIKDLKAGDFVVVNSKRGLGTALVLEIIEDNLDNAEIVIKATNYVVDKFSVSSILDVEQREKRREYLKRKLQEKKEQMEDLIIFQAIAKEDEEASKMLEELKQLTVGTTL